MRLNALVLLSALLPTACRSAPEDPAIAGYLGIERVDLLAKGME